MVIDRLVVPADPDEALELIREKRGVPLGGGLWLRMSGKRIGLAVDLSALGLEYIRDSGDSIEIGAMTSFREMEISGLLDERFGGLFSRVVGGVVGLQFRNMVTAGGTVAGKYAFAGLNAALLALGAKVVLAGEGERDFAAFLAESGTKPFLLEKIALPPRAAAGYSSLAITKGDFSILVAAAAFAGGTWRVAVGARPGAAMLSESAAAALGGQARPGAKAIEAAASAAATELTFSGDMRASSEYRREICPVLVRRALEEAIA